MDCGITLCDIDCHHDRCDDDSRKHFYNYKFFLFHDARSTVTYTIDGVAARTLLCTLYDKSSKINKKKKSVCRLLVTHTRTSTCQTYIQKYLHK